MKFKECYLHLNLIFIVCVSILFGYWYFIDGTYTNKPLTYLKSDISATEEVFNRGDNLKINWKFCKGTNDVATIQTNLVDGVVWYMPEMHGTRHKGCYDGIDIIAKIPEAIPAGEYHLDFHVTYQVNPIKKIQHSIHTNKFLIQ